MNIAISDCTKLLRKEACIKKKSIVKTLSTIFACALMLCTTTMTTFAATTATREDAQELVEDIFVAPAMFGSEQSMDDISVIGSDNPISFFNLAPGKYTKSPSSYYVNQGVYKLDYSVVWTPSSNNIRLGFVNRQNSSKQYYITCTGGEASGTIGTSNVPDGEYYVVIDNPSSNTGNVTGSATFNWQ